MRRRRFKRRGFSGRRSLRRSSRRKSRKINSYRASRGGIRL